MASQDARPTESLSSSVPPSIEPEVALLLTNEERLCEKAITLLLKISSSIVQQPNEKRVRSLNLASRAVEFTLLPAIGAIELLFFMGFQEANDRLVMPEDACLDTVKMYQQQLHLLLNWKTSSRDTLSEGSVCSLQSLCQSSNNSSPASLRSNPLSAAQSSRTTSDRKRTDSASSKDSKSPCRGRGLGTSDKGVSSSPKLLGKSSKSPDKKQSPSAKGTLISNTKAKVLQASQKNTQNVMKKANSPSRLGNSSNKSSSIKAVDTKEANTSPSPHSSKVPASKSEKLVNGSVNSKGSSFVASPPAKVQEPPKKSTKSLANPITNGPTNSSSSSQSATSASTVSEVSGSSSTPSSIITPVGAVTNSSLRGSATPVVHHSTGATNKKISPYKLRPSMRWLNRFSGYLQRVLTYEDPVHQAKARSLIPVTKLHSLAFQRLKEMSVCTTDTEKVEAKGGAKEKTKASKALDFNDHLLMELMLWFKGDFFRWFDCGWCEGCRCNMASKGTVPPTKHELEGEANNVEYYQCQTCHKDQRFPRYLNVGRLLETRLGRCGEWASCFTLCCRVLGFDARQAFDETDHTWTEVWSQSQSRWVHVDPCEARLDCPLLYECGWGKALSYIIAASRDEVVDVTWRYTVQACEVKKRRDKVTEEELAQHLWSLTVQLQQQHQPHTRNQLHLRMIKELASFLNTSTRAPTREELEGRSSGSLGWRMSRGETGLLQTTSHHTFTLHHTARITTLTVKYNPVRDVYSCEGVVGPAELQGWRAGVHSATNIAIKKEHDWHNVYLARTEGETAARAGEIVWRVRWEASRVSLDAFNVVLRHSLYNNAKVTWSVFFGGDNFLGDSSGELKVTNLCSRSANKASVKQKEVSAAAKNANEAADKNGNSKPPAAKTNKNCSKKLAADNKGRPSSASATCSRGPKQTGATKPLTSASASNSPRDKSSSTTRDLNAPVAQDTAIGPLRTVAQSDSRDKENNSCVDGELVVKALLEGGDGDCAWQHAQLFRLPDNDTDTVPFLIELHFK